MADFGVMVHKLNPFISSCLKKAFVCFKYRFEECLCSANPLPLPAPDLVARLLGCDTV